MIILCIILAICFAGALIYIIITNTGIGQFKNTKRQLELQKKNLQSNIQINHNTLLSYQQILDNLTKQIQSLKNQKEKEKNKLNQIITNKEFEINKMIQKYQQQSEKSIQEERNKVEKFKQNSKLAMSSYMNSIEDAYNTADANYNQQIQILNARRASIEKQLEQVRATLQAAAAASLRQREKAQKIQFYKIQITDQQKSDIQKIWPLRSQLYDSSLVSKVVWTSYIQKATTQMCSRVLQDADCGIYRITDLLTNQCYIGQSVNVAQRFKDHVRAGLGINGSNNKLYSAMLKDGVWNFSFELIERCQRNELNAKEKYWIQMYNSSELGLNGNKGNG